MDLQKLKLNIWAGGQRITSQDCLMEQQDWADLKASVDAEHILTDVKSGLTSVQISRIRVEKGVWVTAIYHEMA
jgi:hypothetical protein